MRIPVVRHRTLRRRALRRRVLWSGGELLVTAGVLLLLLVVHQLWWTNREAREGAERRVEALEREWGSSPAAPYETGPGDHLSDADLTDIDIDTDTDTDMEDSGPEPSGSTASRSGAGTSRTSHILRPSQAYAILTIPRLHLRVPVAQGTSKRNVLNKGYVGHYTGTQQPGQEGNFAVAGHRNTHGEPFRRLDRLRVKDTVEVETRAVTFTYVVDKILPQTSPRDSGVLRPVPRSLVKPAYGYDAAGHYLTLTTCTPEYTSRYRLVVWGKLVAVRAD